MSSACSPATAGSRPACAAINGGAPPIHCSYHSANSSYLACVRATFPRHGPLGATRADGTARSRPHPAVGSSPHHDEVARFIPEYVMAQLESPAAWDRLPFTTARYLVVVVNETGLRGGHACRLPVNPGARRRQRLAMPALGDHQGAPWRPSAWQQDSP